MRIIPVMIMQPKKSDPLISRKLTKSAKISKYPIKLLASLLALRPLATVTSDGEQLIVLYNNPLMYLTII